MFHIILFIYNGSILFVMGLYGNETLNTNRDRFTPHLPASDNRALLLKYDYTF